jgi:ketosteroid isomerase-like protein
MKWLGFAFSVAGIVGASAWLPALSAEDARTAIEARYEHYNRAYMQKDFTALAAVFDPAFVLKSPGEGSGSMPLGRMLQGMQMVAKRLSVTNAQTRIVSFKRNGDTCEVAAIWTGDSSYVPPAGSRDDPPRSGKTEQASVDTWKQTAEGWQLVQRILASDD